MATEKRHCRQPEGGIHLHGQYRGGGYSTSSSGGDAGGYGCGYLARSQPAKHISVADTVVPDTDAADTTPVTVAVADMGT